MRNDIDKDLYEILGVSRSSTQSEIKSAYRKKARECHPDVAGDDPDAERKFKELTFAYEILSDEGKRREYDAFGLDGLRRGAGVDFGGFTTFSDLIDVFFGDTFGDAFSRRTKVRTSSRGSDIETTVKVSLAEVATGLDREITLEKKNPCEECEGTGMTPGTFMSRCTSCNGSGQVSSHQRSFFGTFIRSATCPSCRGAGEVITDPCRKCMGEGRHEGIETLKVTIPCGVHDGDYLRIRGRGEAGLRGGPSGDLYVVVEVEPESGLTREGTDILTEITIDMIEAALGTETSIRIFNGEQKIRIGPGTQPGEVLRIKGKGLPPRGGGRKGDLLVTVNVSIPKKISARQRKILQGFRE